jgi:DNA repair protein RecO (recombination protein O)
MAPTLGSSQSLEASALVLGRVPFRDSDLILQLFTDGLGRLSALARGSRKSNKRFSGALEPMHTLRIELSDKPRGELYTLKDAQILRARTTLTTQLDGLTAAGKALNWVKKTAPLHTPEPELWRAITRFLRTQQAG